MESVSVALVSLAPFARSGTFEPDPEPANDWVEVPVAVDRVAGAVAVARVPIPKSKSGTAVAPNPKKSS